MIRRRTISVPGADLPVVVEGRGPLLLLCAGGDGDPAGLAALGRALLTDYTVVSYRRRGWADEPPTVRTHADDLHHLLTALTDEPARVLAVSFAGLIALDLVSRHPEQVAQLVAHEPPAFDLLPPDERAAAVAAHRTVVAGFREHGANPATMRAHAEFTGRRFDDLWEPDVVQPIPDPRRVRELGRFFVAEAPQVQHPHLDLDALRRAPSTIVAAVGSTSAGHVPYRCALGLAALRGTEPVSFPGAHSGATSHPRAFATRLYDVLARASRPTPAQLS